MDGGTTATGDRAGRWQWAGAGGAGGDALVLDSASFRFRDTGRGSTQLTQVGEQLVTVASLSPTQRQIVTALCRPYKHDDPYATPASNQQIAKDLYLPDALSPRARSLRGCASCAASRRCASSTPR